MKQDFKRILIFASTSDIARSLINVLLNKNVEIYGVSRKDANIDNPKYHQFIADLSKEEEINNVFNLFKDINFDIVINFQGVAISSPVALLDKSDLQRQLDISLFSLLAILKNIKDKINNDGKVIFLSSMAAFGIFPFLSPYSISKSSCDILLSCFEMETGIKTISVKPGVVGTKFWNFSVNENKSTFEKCKKEYKIETEFLKKNALKNSKMGLKSKDVGNLIEKIIYSKNPKSSYLIGCDSYFAWFASLLKGRFLYRIIKAILYNRIKRFKDEK